MKTKIDQSSHYKGLSVIFVSSLFERFAYYILIAILVLSLQLRYNISNVDTGVIYSLFHFIPYLLNFAAGPLGDKFKYGKVALFGLIGITISYAILSLSANSFSIAIFGTFLLSIVSPFFLLNRTILCANLYETKSFRKYGASGFVLFYLAANVGFFFSIYAVEFFRDIAFNMAGLEYNAELARMSQDYLSGSHMNIEAFISKIQCTIGNVSVDIDSFSANYITTISKGHTYGYLMAFAASLISLSVFWFFKKHYKYADEEKQRQISLLKETNSPVKRNKPGFILLVILASLLMFIVSNTFGVIQSYGNLAGITEESLQKVFNPMFVIILTPVIIIVFSFLQRNNKSLSLPKIIITGVSILTLLYLIQLLVSFSATNAEVPISPVWFVSMIGVITLVEILVGPMIKLFAIRSFPIKRKGLWLSIFLFVMSIGGSVSSYLMNIFNQYTEYYILSILLLAGSILLFFLIKRKDSQ